MMMVVLTLIFGIKINVKADSSTTYDSRHPYLLWWESDKQAVNDLNGIDNQILWNKYFNIPLRVANYCVQFPNRSLTTGCSSTYDSSFIGNHGLSNGSLREANPYSRYTANVSDVFIGWKDGFDNYRYNHITNNYGYIDSELSSYAQTHKQNVYYSIDIHNTYPIRSSLSTVVSLPDVPLTSTNKYAPPFAKGNVIAYKMSYMLGPAHGSYGDGSYSNTSHRYNTGAYTSRNTNSLTYVANFNGDYAYNAYENGVRPNALFWLINSDNYDYIDENTRSWYYQNIYFAEMFDKSVYDLNNNSIKYSGCYADSCAYGPQYFQGSSPMSQFLSMYGHTYYDKESNTGYYQTFEFEHDYYSYDWYPSPSVFGIMRLKSNGTEVAKLSTSVILVAQPYYYEYDDNGTPYYSDVWFLDVWFFGYLDDTYSFNQIDCSFSLENQLSMFPQYSQIDIISPDTSVMVIGSVDNVSAITTAFFDDIMSAIENIPVIGGIFSIVLNLYVFIFSFIYNVVILFVSLPLWIRGGFILLFTAMVIKLLDKLVRGG